MTASIIPTTVGNTTPVYMTQTTMLTYFTADSSLGVGFIMVHPIYSSFTLPKTNIDIAPENGPSRPSQKERFALQSPIFRG